MSYQLINKRSKIKISVIIPVYNDEKYLDECISSIINQTLSQIEIICIDDGSSDSSLDILNKYESEGKIVLLKKVNGGAGTARNLGLIYAKGEYIAFMDADDFYYRNDVLEKMYNVAIEKEANIVGGNLIYLQNGEYHDHYARPLFLDKWNDFNNVQDIYGFTRYIYKREMLNSNSISFPEFRLYEDPIFLLKVMLVEKKYYTISDLIYVYRYVDSEKIYSKNQVRDWLNGIKMCFEIAKENNLQLLYYNRLSDFIISDFFQGKMNNIQDNDELWNIIEEINFIDRNWLGGDKIYATKSICQSEIDCAKSEINKYKYVIIYGAGKIGNILYSKLKEYMKNFVGFAVTNLENSNADNIYCIDELIGYKETALIIIGVGKRYKEEVLEELNRKGFKNIYAPNPYRL